MASSGPWTPTPCPCSSATTTPRPGPPRAPRTSAPSPCSSPSAAGPTTRGRAWACRTSYGARRSRRSSTRQSALPCRGRWSGCTRPRPRSRRRPGTPGCPCQAARCWCSTRCGAGGAGRGGCGSLDADDPDLAAVRAAIHVGFGAAGTASRPAVRGRARRRGGRGRHLAGRDARGGPGRAHGPGRRVRRHGRAGGRRQPQPPWRGQRDRGCGVLPAYRRRGLAAAVAALLAGDARSGASPRCSARPSPRTWPRIYERIGFRRVGTACIAEQD